MFELVARGARIALFFVGALALSVSVSGQPVSASGTGGGQAPQAAGSGVVKKLSVDEAVQLALEQNLDLQVQRVNPRVRELSIQTARTAWTPNFTSGLSNSNATNSNYNRYAASGSTLTTDRLQWSFGANQQLPWGGNYDLLWGSGRTKTNNAFDFTNPALGSYITASYTQSLMRNFSIDGARQQLLISRKNREISDMQLRQTVLATIRNVKSAYWNLSYAVASLAVQQQTLDLARESLKNSEARVKVGTLAPMEVIQSQAEVASREESVIRAQATVAQTEDQFRALIMDPQTPGFWDMKFELSDAPAFQAQVVDIDAAVRKALDVRTDLTQQRKTIEENDITLRYMRNQTLPDVNVQASYSMNATGGTTYNYDDSGNFLGITKIGYGSVLNSLLRRDLPTWSFVLRVNYPIGKSNAEASLASARLQYEQAKTQLRSAELGVITEVRNAARNVTTNQKRVESTRTARELQERKLEAEQKKFAAGMSTTFFVLQAQRDLATARNAELQAILDYTRSVVDFETVQQAPTYGGGGGVVISSGGQ
jgi:outer membrane protein TolC